MKTDLDWVLREWDVSTVEEAKKLAEEDPDLHYKLRECGVKFDVTEKEFRRHQELWNSNPRCSHEIYPKPEGGVVCIKCGGWYCL